MLEYHPRNHYVNDFTVIKKDGVYHLFHITGERLKLSRGLTDQPRQGHAESRDLFHWKELPFVTALGGACSAVRHKDRYALIDNVNKICWSRDMMKWSEPQPLHFDFKKSVYETEWVQEKARYNSHRDPNIHRDPERKSYLMFFCSRVRPEIEPDIFLRGCVGMAESEDLVHWKPLPPALPHGRHVFPESPHVIDIDGRYHMFFTISPENGLRHAVADSLRGPYREVENQDLLPCYVSASETVKTGRGWLFLGRLEDRTERCNRSRLAPRALCLPLGVRILEDDSVAFRALPELEKFRGNCLFDSKKHNLGDGWKALSGDCRINRSRAKAANLHEDIPANSFFLSGNITTALVGYMDSVADFDLEFDMQLPTFNGNDVRYRGGFIIDGVKFSLCSVLKSFSCQDPDGDILAVKFVPQVKLDRYYRIRVFRCDGITQLYMDGNLLMYLPAYGRGEGRIEFFADHNDLIVKDIRLWEVKAPYPSGFDVDDPKGDIMNGIRF